MKTESWQVQFQAEISHAIAAREKGNEGMARVCARRAAGVVIGEVLRRRGFTSLPPSIYDRWQMFADIPGLPPQYKDIAAHFLVRVTPEHTLPLPVDLIAEAQQLAAILLEAN